MKALDKLIVSASRPVPLKTELLRKLLRRWPVGSYEARLRAGAVRRPHYGWCAYFAAAEAKMLGHKAITVAEFGVAGGRGLVCLLEHKAEIERALGIEVLVVGFDSGAGLPASRDSRDLLYTWPAGAFGMDRGALEKRLGGRARLVLGDVAQTVGPWQPESHAPLGAVLFDLDYYSSTLSALAVLTKENVLPRVWCYFDDVAEGPEEALTERIGERQAIADFNRAPERGKLNDHLGLCYAFKLTAPEWWHQHIFVYHRAAHPDYNTCIRAGSEELRLR